MAFKKTGWDIMIGVCNSTITNGVFTEGSDNSDIEVYIPELVPQATGVPDKVGTSEQCKVTNPLTKEVISATVPKMQTVRCQYWGQPNQLIPCVYPGEQVWVLQYAGGELNYYWLPIGRTNDQGHRLHENVRWFIMDQSSSERVEENTDDFKVTDDNTFFIAMNTNKGSKFIHIHTAKGDGEPVGYDIRIWPEDNSANGGPNQRLEIVDTYGNELSLDSATPRWYMYNIDDSYVELNKKDINIHCLHDLTVFAGNDISVTAGHDRTTKIGNDETRTVVQDCTDTIGRDSKWSSGRIISRTAVTGPMTDISGTTYALSATSGIEIKAPTFSNLSDAITFSNKMFTVSSTGIVISGTTTNLVGKVNISLTGLLTNIFTTHGNINALVW